MNIYLLITKTTLKISLSIRKLLKIIFCKAKIKDKKSIYLKIVSKTFLFFALIFVFFTENVKKSGFIANLFNKVKSSFSDALTAGFTSINGERD